MGCRLIQGRVGVRGWCWVKGVEKPTVVGGVRDSNVLGSGLTVWVKDFLIFPLAHTWKNRLVKNHFNC